MAAATAVAIRMIRMGGLRPRDLGLHLLTVFPRGFVAWRHFATIGIWRECAVRHPPGRVAKAPQRGAFEIAVRKPMAGSCPRARDLGRGAHESAPRRVPAQRSP